MVTRRPPAPMEEDCANQAIGDRLGFTTKTVESHVRSIFLKLDLAQAADPNRRVLAGLTYLRS